MASSNQDLIEGNTIQFCSCFKLSLFVPLFVGFWTARDAFSACRWRAHSWVAWRCRLGRRPGGGLGLAGYRGCSGAMNVEAILYMRCFVKKQCFCLPENREIFMCFFWSYQFGNLFTSSWYFQILVLGQNFLQQNVAPNALEVSISTFPLWDLTWST